MTLTQGYVPNFRDIYDNKVTGDRNPFRFIKIHDNYDWLDDYRLRLNNSNLNLFGTNPSGSFEMIMKPDWEARIRISTQSYGAFGSTIEDALGERNIEAYNFEFNTPLVNLSSYDSSMTFTLRGDGMLGVWVDGHPTGQVWGTGAFDDEVRFRLGNDNRPTAFNNGFFISLTHPFGDYGDSGTYTLKINDVDNETVIEILEIKERRDVNTRPVDESSDHEPISVQDITNRYVFAQDYNDETDKGYEIEIGSIDGSFFVFLNGTVVDFYSSESKARERAERVQRQAIIDMNTDPSNTDPVDNPIRDIVVPSLGTGLGLIIAILAILLLARRR